MKYVLLSLPILLLIYLFFFYSPEKPETLSHKGIVFQEINFTTALKKATTEKKIIFIDVFTTWCGPCKQLKKTTFQDENVKKYFDAHFINLALDAEKTEGELFLQKFPIQGYPTLLFINEKGELVKQHLGFINAEEIINLASNLYN